MSELPQKFPCPRCFVSVRVPEQGHPVTCLACQVVLDVVGHLCADCGTYHEEAVSLCVTCGLPMTQVCRRCRTLNWAGDVYCQNCNAGLDVIETLRLRSTEGTTAVAQQQMREAHKIKTEEAAHSAQRMAQLMAKEAARQAELHRREEIVQAQTRQMWLKTAVIITLVIVIVIAAVLLT